MDLALKRQADQDTSEDCLFLKLV